MSGQKQYEMLFRLSAQLSGNYNSTFLSAQQGVAAMQKEIDALNKTQSDIKAYQKQQQAIANTESKLEMLEKQYANIQQEIKATENVSSSLANSEIAKKAQIDKTKEALEGQKQSLSELGLALGNAEVNTQNFAEETQRLSGEIDQAKQKQMDAADSFASGLAEMESALKQANQAQQEAGDGAEQFGNKTEDAARAMQELMVAAGVVKVLKEMASTFRECVNASVEYESAVTGVYKTVDGTERQLQAISDSIKEMSLVIPESTTNIAAVAEAAGQLGIATEDIMFFTEVMTNLGVATNLSATEAASQLAKFANITQMAASDYEALGSTVVALGNNLATTEADIVNMAMRLASAGTQVGMTEADIVSISAALSSLGLESQAGGSSFSKAISQMQIAVETGSDSLMDFANIAGYSVDEFSRLFAEDATSALIAFTQGLADTERHGESATVLLDEMGITELRLSDALKRAASSGDLFNEAIQLGNQAWGENVALTNEAALRYGTTESQMQLCENAANLLKISIGDQLTPVLGNLANVGADAFAWAAEFVEDNPQLVALLTAATVGVGAFTVALAAYTIGANVAKIATDAFNASIAGTPVGWIAIAFAGIAAAVTAVGIASANAAQETEDSYAAMTSATKDAQRALKEISGEFESTATSTVNAAGVASGYVDRLRELETQGLNTVGAQAEYESIVARLNALMPELNLEIDAQTGLLQGNTDAIYDNIEALKEQALAAAYQEEQGEILTQRAEVEKEIYANKASLNAAQSEENKLMDEATRLAKENEQLRQNLNALAIDDIEGRAALESQMAANNERQKECVDSAGELSSKQWDLKEAIEKGEGVLADFDAELESSAEAYNLAKSGALDMTDAVDDLTLAQMEAESKATELSQSIITAYEEAKAAARENIDSVVSGFTEMDNSARTSAWEVQQALNSQVQYLQNYSTNLQGLADRNIEGIDTLVQMLSDGSTESAAILAGLSGTTDEEIACIIASLAAVEEGKEAFTEVVGALAPETQQAMDAAIAEAQRYDDMQTAGELSGQGLVDGLMSKMDDVVTAGTALGNAFTAAYKAAQDQHSPSRKMIAAAQDTVAGLIVGFQREAPVLEAVVKETTQSVVKPFGSEAEMQCAMQSYASDAAQVVMLSPALAAAMQRQEPAGVTGLDMSTVHSGSGITIEFAPVYNISGVNDASEVQSTLSRHDVGLKDYILEVLEEAGIDAGRVKFK